MEDKSYYVKQQKEKNPERFYVYIHRRLSDNKPFYVGKGSGDRAWWKHHRRQWWENVVVKHGFKVEIVFDNLDEEVSFDCEKNTILEFRYFGYPLVNLTDGGDGPSGRILSEETRKRMSNSQKTSLKVLEARKRTSARRLGTEVSKETKQKQSQALKGKPKTEAHRLSAQKAKRCPTIYTFTHKDGRVFMGTRYEFEIFSCHGRLEVSLLFGKHANQNMKGWSLAKNDNLILQNNKEGNNHGNC